ncbi:hypothetical protein ATY77_19150 [Rhizobium sp. R634]|nr:hypothetical protein ATY77_19150 [Rhizobium sp. R634]
MTEEDVEPAETHEAAKQRPEIRWGIGASVLLHVPVVALLIFGLPKIEPKPPEDESVKVELVPPPEEKKQEEKKPEEKPPEPKPPEEAKKEPPPPPPPPPSPPPPPPPPPAPKSSPPPAGLRGTAPVFEFGDKNSGKAKTKNGNASEGEIDDTAAPPPSSSPETQPKQAADAAEKMQPTEQPAGNPIPEEVNVPETATAAIHPERDAPAAAATEEARTSFEPETPKAKAPQADQVSKTPLPEVKRLFSQNATDDPVARTALGNLSRGQRMNDLCRTELEQQIEHISPKYRDPEVPTYPPFTNETIIRVMETGRFRKGGDWYSMQFECQVDADATKILSFAFRFGGLIPRSQYAKYKIRE